MNPLIFAAAALAGGVGAALRYLVDVAIMTGITRRRAAREPAGRARFPWGIVVVNITGSFALGVVTASLPEAAFVVGAGLLGGYTTFSTAMLDSLALWKDGARAASIAHLGGTFAASVAAALAGLALGFAL